MSPILSIAAGAAFALLLLAFLPRLAIRRAQDRLAQTLLAGGGEAPALLTRAELCAGKWRRVPGVLGLAGGALTFTGLFGETVAISTSRIAKIVTGRRLASGRLLFRMEVLRISRPNGEEVQFVLEPASASAWRSHLGLWAMAERMRAGAETSEQVVPGRQ